MNEEKRIAPVRINTVLKKLLTGELCKIKILTVDQSDILKIMPDSFKAESFCIHKDLIVDFLIDYKNALENEIKALEEQ